MSLHRNGPKATAGTLPVPLLAGGPKSVARAPRGLAALLPGVTLVVICVAVAYSVNKLFSTISPLVVAVVLGAILTNAGLIPERCRPGLRWATKRLLRAGIVLLGFRLALNDIIRLGAPALAVVFGVVGLTFTGTQWLGRRLGISRGLSLLVATGFSICGASAIAAMEPLADASEEDVAFSIALVTLCGSLAIVVLPGIGHLLGLRPEVFGSWVGASVHDVGQVVATASTGGTRALSAAIVVKLTRVALLAPMVAIVSVQRRRNHRPATPATASRATACEPAPAGAIGPATPVASATAAASTTAPETAVAGATDETGHLRTKRPPIVPLFVLGFLAAATVRSSSVLPADWFPKIQQAETLLLAGALVGLGSAVQFARLRLLGVRPLILGMASWLLIAVASLGGVVLVHR